MAQVALDARVLLPSDKESVLAWARQRLARDYADPMEQEMKSWSARWRAEALDHYLPQGWSYGVYAQGELSGILLAQPILFMRGLTQTLWVEHLDALTSGGSHVLLDTAYRWARDKHFQCLLIEPHAELNTILSDWKNAQPLSGPLIEIKSARF